MIRQLLAPLYLAKLNVKSAFCRIPVCPEEWPLLNRWQDQYCYESVLPFRLYYAPGQLYGTLSHPPVNGLCAGSSHSHACCITGNTSINVTSSMHALDLCYLASNSLFCSERLHTSVFLWPQQKSRVQLKS